jgi:hypothetical protein
MTVSVKQGNMKFEGEVDHQEIRLACIAKSLGCRVFVLGHASALKMPGDRPCMMVGAWKAETPRSETPSTVTRLVECSRRAERRDGHKVCGGKKGGSHNQSWCFRAKVFHYRSIGRTSSYWNGARQSFGFRGKVRIATTHSIDEALGCEYRSENSEGQMLTCAANPAEVSSCSKKRAVGPHGGCRRTGSIGGLSATCLAHYSIGAQRRPKEALRYCRCCIA